MDLQSKNWLTSPNCNR